jgi:hypothetical protein
MKIIELKAYPTSFPLPPEGRVKHPVIEGPSYV